jgi:hypothetical protein
LKVQKFKVQSKEDKSGTTGTAGTVELQSQTSLPNRGCVEPTLNVEHLTLNRFAQGAKP